MPDFSVLSALSQPTRWRVFELLLQRGEEGMLHNEIAQALDVPKSLMAAHLKVLSAARLVSSERNGRLVTYRVEPGLALSSARAVLDSIERKRPSIS